MPTATTDTTTKITRETLIEKLNEDLSREYQAIIAYVIYSQTIKGAKFNSIAKELYLSVLVDRATKAVAP